MVASDETSPLAPAGYRVAAAYGMHPDQMLGHFTVTGSRPRHEDGTVQSDAELVLNGGRRRILTGLSGVDQHMLNRALPAFPYKDAKAGTDGDTARGVARGRGGRGAGDVRLPPVRDTAVRGRGAGRALCAAVGAGVGRGPAAAC